MTRRASTLVFLGFVCLAGCAGDPEPVAPSETTESAAPTSSAPAAADDVAADDLYIAGLQSGGIEYTDPETMQILGRGICSELQQGQPVIAEVDAVTTGSRGKWDESAAGAIVGTAIGAYCPEFRALLPG